LAVRPAPGPEGEVGRAEWERHRINTKKAYSLYLIWIVDRWGPLSVASAGRDADSFTRNDDG
jgi:hypothetical protein